MAKLELKGIVTHVSPITTIGEKNTKKQHLILKVLSFRDQFGEQRSPDEEWQLEVIGERVGKLDLLSKGLVNKKAKIVAYISSRKWTKDEKDMYFISANLGEIEVVGEYIPEPAQLPVPAGDDDLPF